MKIKQTRNFEKSYKKLHKNQIVAVDSAVSVIACNPEIGEAKKGDLSGVRVYKFRVLEQLTLLAYCYYEKEKLLMLLALGAHENFYRDIKNIL